METPQTILITGGCVGKGLKLARHFSKSGKNVIATASRISAQMKIVYRECDITALELDVTSDTGIVRLLDYLDAHRITVDFFVNNAGEAYTLAAGLSCDGNESEAISHYLSGIRILEELLGNRSGARGITYLDLSQAADTRTISTRLLSVIRNAATSYLKLLWHRADAIGRLDIICPERHLSHTAFRLGDMLSDKNPQSRRPYYPDWLS